MAVNPLGPSGTLVPPTTTTANTTGANTVTGANAPVNAPVDTFQAAPTANKPADYATRTIKSGDTLWGIASSLKKAGDTRGHWDIINDIKALNPQIKDVNKIYVGQVFKLPPPPAKAGTSTTPPAPSNAKPPVDTTPPTPAPTPDPVNTKPADPKPEPAPAPTPDPANSKPVDPKADPANPAPAPAPAPAPGPIVNGTPTDPSKPAPNLPQGPVTGDDLGPVGTPAGGTARVPNDVEDLKDRNGVPWVSQLKPTGAEENFQNGQFYCGPASLAMEARRRGYGTDLTDAQLINKLAEVGKTKPVTGTSMNGIVAMAKEIGVPVEKSEVKYPGFDATWMDAQLDAGKDVVINGALESPNGPSGHFMLVTGKDEKGAYKINDPWDSENKRMTPDELGAFLARNPVHHGASVALG